MRINLLKIDQVFSFLKYNLIDQIVSKKLYFQKSSIKSNSYKDKPKNSRTVPIASAKESPIVSPTVFATFWTASAKVSCFSITYVDFTPDDSKTSTPLIIK